MDEAARHRVALAAILALGGLLRLVHLGAIGLNSDEAVYLGQAAALARVPQLADLFPIFRAHPLLVQSLLAIVMRLAPVDIAGRLLAVAFGLATVWLTYQTGRLLYGRTAGLAAGLLLAVMPYHVVVTRQVLLDGPMTLFATLSLYLLARFAIDRRPRWLYAAGASLGLTVLSKETGIVLLAAVYAFLALTPSLRLRLRDLLLATATMALVLAPYPLSLALAGNLGTSRSQQYLVWQLSRRPNHEWDFYPTAVGPAIGLLVLLLAVIGLLLPRRQSGFQRTLLAAWITVPLVFFQLWPVKGFHYLLLIAPPVAILAGAGLAQLPPRLSLDAQRRPLPAAALAAVLLAGWLGVHAYQAILGPSQGRFLAGSGGVPGGREAGLWLADNSPQGSTLMTIGPSMANILQFYGQRRALGLSVSPNPLHRNPAYQPVRNPDFELRTGEIQYVVWDAYSANRSSFFSEKIQAYANRYHGRAVHTETMTFTSPSGEPVTQPVIIIYEVRP
ncbi:MAG TPA: glycosyltransferase family 39 protein [Anaerolineales bacterium]|jgi:4-amino-4-deoxy-L-arabinose transferase-like glycosyltransferase